MGDGVYRIKPRVEIDCGYHTTKRVCIVCSKYFNIEKNFNSCLALQKKKTCYNMYVCFEDFMRLTA